MKQKRPKFCKTDDARGDFLRCLRTAAPAGTAAAAILFFFSTLPALSFDRYLRITFFATGSADYAVAAWFLLLAAGMGAALQSFRFLHSARFSNVVFSYGLSRARLYINRCAACALTLLVGVFLPLTLSLFINIYKYSMSGYLLKVYFFFLLSAFTAALIGMTAGFLGALLSGKIREGVAASCSILLLPFFIPLFIDCCRQLFLRGYVYTCDLFPSELLERLFWLTPLTLLYDKTGTDLFAGDNNLWYTLSSFPSPEYAGMGLRPASLFLFLIWSAVCVSVLFAAYRLFLNRKAERCGHAGTDKQAAFLTITALMLAAALFGCMCLSITCYDDPPCMPYDSTDAVSLIMFAVILLLPGTVALAVALRLYAGRPKKRLYILKHMPAVLLVLVIPAVFLLGGFGYESRVPDVEEIQSVTLEAFSLPYNGDFNSDFFVCGFTTEKDKELVTKLHKQLIRKTEKNTPERITLNYVLKDGSTLTREYYIYSEKAYRALTDLFDSDAVEQYITKQFRDESSWSDGGEGDSYQESCFPFYPLHPANVEWLTYGGSTVSFLPALGTDAADLTNLTESEFRELRKHLAFDLVAMTGKDFYSPSEKRKGVIRFTQIDENNEYDDPYMYDFNLYPSMKKTLAFIEKTASD